MEDKLKIIPSYNGKKIFDPRIIEKDGSSRLWTSQSVKLADNGLMNGYKLIDNPYNQRIKDAKLRKANLPFQYTTEEIEILKKCYKDIKYFGNNYISLKDADRGWQRITLRNYQEDLLDKYDNNRFNILLFPRQSGKTTTTIVKIVHFLTFNKDKDCVVIAQSDTVVTEIMNKIREAFQSLPFFMQPGFIQYKKDKAFLDNGCRLSIGIASESVVQGFSLDLLFIDEFAYIPPSKVDKFWANIYPALTNNSKSRCIIASTPNGRNKFYDLWTNAINGLNSFVASRIYWWDVPRTISQEEFKIETIKNVGMDAWLMGYECSFDVGLKCVFHTPIQQKLRDYQRDGENYWSNTNHPLGEKFKDFVFLDRNIFDYDFKKDYFLLSSDLSEGLEQDSTTLKVNKIWWNVERQRLEYRQVAVYHSNETAIEDFAELSLEFISYFDRKKIRYVVESNTYGGEYFQKVKNLIMYDDRFKGFDMTFYAKFLRNTKKDYDYGIRWHEENKKVGVKSFSKIIGNGTFYTDHFLTIEQYLNFGRQKNGTYKANYGHDDLTMSDVVTSYFICNNDIYIKSFLLNVKYELKILANDLDAEQIEKASSIERKIAKNKIVIMGYNRNMKIRDHKECMNQRISGEYYNNMKDDWSDNYGRISQRFDDNSVILI